MRSRRQAAIDLGPGARHNTLNVEKVLDRVRNTGQRRQTASAAGGVDNRESGSAAQLAGDDIGHKAKVG